MNVVDYSERQKGVKTLTPFLREKLIYEAETLDKYSQVGLLSVCIISTPFVILTACRYSLIELCARA